MLIRTSTLQKTLGATADVARLWFESRTDLLPRSQFEKKRGLRDNGTGAVYAYFESSEFALYVGQTSRKVKARLHDETAAHKKAPWWPNWKHVRFLQIQDEMDRLILEFMLILAYAPANNKKPKAKNLDELFLHTGPASEA